MSKPEACAGCANTSTCKKSGPETTCNDGTGNCHVVQRVRPHRERYYVGDCCHNGSGNPMPERHDLSVFA